MTIYTITTLGKSNSSHKVPDNVRTVGWFENWDDADWVVANNKHLYEDGYYPYLIITGLDPGLYPRPISKWLYKWNKEKKKYIQVNKNNMPKWFFDYNYGIG